MNCTGFGCALRRGCLVAMAGVFACAQTTPPAQTAIERERLAYYNAYRIWRESDPNLERDLATAPANDLRRRIEKMRAKALAYTRARAAYYDALLSSYDAIVARLGDSSQPLQLDELIADLKAQQTSLAAQTEAMSRELKALGSDPQKSLQQQAAERQWGALASLQSNLSDQLRLIGEIAASSAASARSRVVLLRHYQAAAALLRQEAGFTRQEGSLWQAYYDSLARALGNRRLPAAAARPLRLKPTDNAASVQPDHHPAWSRWTGSWVYRRLRKKTFFGARPEFATLQLTVVNGFAQGSYVARYKLPRGIEGSPDVAFSFGGRIAAGNRQTFALQNANRSVGSIEIHMLGASGSVEVVWNRVSNGKTLAFADDILQRQ